MMDLSEYKNAEAWEAKMIKLIPNYEKVRQFLRTRCWEPKSYVYSLQVNGEGCEGFGAFYKSKAA